MYKVLAVAVSIALVPTLGLAQWAEIEVRDYKGNTSPAEKDEALRLKGVAKAGEADFNKYCAACHLPTGRGNLDGSIPQLAGQHPTVLIKQLTDIRSGLRYNPTMYPFARELAGPQAVANVAAYVATLCIPLDSGKYQGPDAAKQVADGKALYEKECAQCHQMNGEGNSGKAYPVLAGQHYRYLLRQMTDIRDRKRLNAPPEMLEVIGKYSDTQLVAIAAYQSTLATPSTMLMRSSKMCKTNPSRL
jgi:cytochrome c553